MMFSKDSFDRLDRPYTYLANPNKEIIGAIQARELSGDLCFNNISQINFKVNKYEDGEPTLFYDEIENKNLIEVSYVGWFQITSVNIEGNGNNEFLEVTISSLENEACSKTLTSFGQLGVTTDEQGGLDRYKLCDYTDINHSILHIWLEKMPSWTIGYIDPEITTEFRTFTNDEVGAYSFLVEDVATTYECIFQFDTFNQTVNCYKLENIGVNTSIYLSYDNLINNTSLKSNASDIITVYSVAGGDDNGTTLGIIEVNPSGNNQITNFSYYKRLMSEALRTKLDAYEIEYNNRLLNFTPAVDLLQTYYEELNILNTKLPSVSTSTNWTEYGLVELKTKYDVYNNNMAIYIGKSDLTSITNYNTNYNLRQSINAELLIRQAQVNAKEAQIVNQKLLCESITLNLAEYLGTTLYKEISRYYHESTFTDDTFVVTKLMTDAERLETQRGLLALAQRDLAKKCKPSYSLDVDVINFTAIPEFQKFTDQLALGNIMTLDFGNDILVESRLLKLHVNWDDPNDFSMTFSSKNSLDSYEYQLAEIHSQSNSASTAHTISGTGWNVAKNKTSTFNEYMTSNFNLQKQKLFGGTHETFVTDGTGTLWRKWDDDTNDYSPNQMWGTSNGLFMTNNSWQGVSTAIGEGIYNGQPIYGIWTKLLCGDMILGNNLAIINSSGNYTINDSGFTATATVGVNTYSAGINPSTPSEIINVKVNGVNQLYIDVNTNKLIFNGTLSATAINAQMINALNITAGSVSSSWVYTNNLSAGQITTGTFSADRISGGTITGINITGSTITSVGSTYSTTITNGYIQSNYVSLMSGSNSTFLYPNMIQVGNADQTLYITATDIWGGGRTYLSSSNYPSYIRTSYINPDLTAATNIDFGGAQNGASVNWCQLTFEPKSASDFRLKKNIRNLDELPDSIYFSLKPKLFEFKCDPYKMDSSSIGLLAQEVISAFENVGLDAFQYGLVEYFDARKYTDECMYTLDGKLLRINYGMFTTWGIRINQKQQLKIESQQFELVSQQFRIEKLEELILGIV